MMRAALRHVAICVIAGSLLVTACTGDDSGTASDTTAERQPTTTRSQTTFARPTSTTVAATTTSSAGTTSEQATTTSIVAADPPDPPELVVAFTGDTCTYEGPAAFDLNTEVTVEVDNHSTESFGFSVWKIPDGTTIEDIETLGMLTVGGDMSENMRGLLRPGSIEHRVLTVTLNETGTWGMDCFTLVPGTLQTDSDYAAAVVEVQTSE